MKRVRVLVRGRRVVWVTGIALLAALSVAFAAQAKRNAAAAPPPPDKITFDYHISSMNFAFRYFNDRAAGTPPVDGATIQITSGDPTVLQSVTFGGMAGKPTGAQSAFSFYPLNIPSGSTLTGTGTTSAPLPPGTTFKFFFTTDAFATTANTNSLDVTLSTAAPSERLKLTGTKKLVQAAITQEGEALKDGPKSEIGKDELGSVIKLQVATNKLRRAHELGEIDAATEFRIRTHLQAAIQDDVKAGAAAHGNDTNSAKHWLNKALPEKEKALSLIDAALAKP